MPEPWRSAAVVAAGILLALAIALVGYGVAMRVLLVLARRRKAAMAQSILLRVRTPGLFAAVLLALALAVHGLPVPADLAAGLSLIMLAATIGLVGWGAVVFINVVSDLVRRRYNVDVEDNLEARKRVTHIQVLRRAGITLVVLITLGAMLLVHPAARDFGVSLFASAGVAGLVIGLAARPVFANLIAGIQIAFTQPIRIDDAVVIEGEWGWIEEITATYVVVRIWDWRRLIVPLSTIIEKPFQNWTRETASIIGSVFWTVDYTVPVAEVRTKLEELLKESPLWDGRVANLQVTEAQADGVVLRGLMSARNSPAAWDLRCDMREKVMAWLQQAYPSALPRMRAELDAPSGAESRGGMAAMAAQAQRPPS